MRNFKKIFSLIICVVMVFATLPIVNSLNAKALTTNLQLLLKNGPNYTFVSSTDVNSYGPQFTEELKTETAVPTDVTQIQFDISMNDFENLRNNMKNGSAGGSITSSSFVYTSSGFAIYFSGTDVSKVGVTQKNFYTALDENAEALTVGEKVTLTLDISGSFNETSVITALNIMVSREDDAEAFEGKAFTLENIVFNPSDDTETPPENEDDFIDDDYIDDDFETDIPSDNEPIELVLANGPNFVFAANGWYPQFAANTVDTCEPQTDFNKICFDIRIPDIETLRTAMCYGSRGGGATYDSFSYSGTDFAIYFSGENVTRVGVTQEDFFAAIDANLEALSACEIVTMEFDLSGQFVEEAKITGIHIMVSHDSHASVFANSPLYLSDMYLYYQTDDFDDDFDDNYDDEFEELPEIDYGYSYEDYEVIYENNYYYVLSSGMAVILAYDGFDSELTIPSILGGFPVERIESYAFAFCEDLTSVIIPNNVTTIGYGAFSGCINLSDITISDNVVNIGYDAFYDTEYYYNESNWENDVLYIGNHLIKADFLSEEYTVKDGTKTISPKAFSNCIYLSDISIPYSVVNIGYGAFCDTEFYYDESNWDNGVLYIDNHLIEADFLLSDEYSIKEGTKTIAENAFETCAYISKIFVPSSVTNIGNYAFSYCYSLENITISNGVTKIGDCAFEGCSSLSRIIIPDSVTYLGHQSFLYCISLTTANIGKGLTKILPQTFIGCTTLSNITFGDNIKYIGKDVFYGCYLLKGVNIKDIGAWCQISFDNFSSNPLFYAEKLYINGKLAVDIVIPDAVTCINDFAFVNCINIESVSIPKSIENIGESAFEYCISLKEIKIPEGVYEISEYAFYNCYSLESVVLPKSVENINEASFFGCYSLSDVYYTGNKSEWDNITISLYNEDLENAILHLNFGDFLEMDIDNNEVFDILDIIAFKTIMLNYDVENIIRCDVNNDGYANSQDLIVLRKTLFENF